REILHKPFGTLIQGDIPKECLTDPQCIVTVGDVTTKQLHLLGVQQKLSVIDFQIERKKTNETLMTMGFTGNENILTIANPAGKILPGIWDNLRNFISHVSGKENSIVIVKGEEDLLVIPLILMLPLGFTLFYGQPNLQKTGESGVVFLQI